VAYLVAAGFNAQNRSHRTGWSGEIGGGDFPFSPCLVVCEKCAPQPNKLTTTLGKRSRRNKIHTAHTLSHTK